MNKFQTAIIILLSIIIILLGLNLIPYFSSNQNQTTANSSGTNLWQVLNWQTTILFGFLAALLALFQAIFNTFQKMKELRWTKANLARELVDSVYEDELAHDALRMVDQSKTQYTDKLFKVTPADVTKALAQTDLSNSSIYVRNCFDTLFYYLERMEHSIEVGVVNIDDLKSHFAYYMTYFKNDSKTFVDYCNKIKYPKAANFITRLWV